MTDDDDFDDEDFDLADRHWSWPGVAATVLEAVTQMLEEFQRDLAGAHNRRLKKKAFKSSASMAIEALTKDGNG